MKVRALDRIKPSEENGFCVFCSPLEERENIFFHLTKASNKESILEDGFKSGLELGQGNLDSVSYANKSSCSFANVIRGSGVEYIIFAVWFSPKKLSKVTINYSDIHVHRKDLQPKVVAFVHVPPDFNLDNPVD